MAVHRDNAGVLREEGTGTLYAGELEIRLGEGLVLAAGAALTLSVREFELLVALAHRLGAIVTREELYGSVWGGDLRPGDRSVDVYVSKLRGKLEEAMPDRRFIHTHPGFGYRFQPQAWRTAATDGTALGMDDPIPTDSIPTDAGPETPAAPADHAAPVAAGAPSWLSRDVHNGAGANPRD